MRSATNGSQAFLRNTGADSLFLYNATVKDLFGQAGPVKVVNGINNGNNIIEQLSNPINRQLPNPILTDPKLILAVCQLL